MVIYKIVIEKFIDFTLNLKEIRIIIYFSNRIIEWLRVCTKCHNQYEIYRHYDDNELLDFLLKVAVSL